MVSIPVRLLPAVRRKSISFNQLDSDTMSRIRYRKVAEATGEEVPADKIVKAAEVGREEYVVITDDDLAPLAPAKTKQIELETFVESAEIDPMMFDASYWVIPDKTAKPYALLASAMAGSGRVGIGRFVMRQKEYLAAVRSDGEHLMLSTLVFPDEMVDAGSVDEFEQLDDVEVSDKELKMARSLVEALSEEFQPEQYVDEYRNAVQQLIEEKAAGKAPTIVEEEPKRAKVIDLAAALEASLREAAEAKKRHPSSGAAAADEAEEETGEAAATAAAAGSAPSRSRSSAAKKAAKPKTAPRKKVAAAAETPRPRVKKSA